MNQYQSTQRRRSSGGGCGRVALFGGGCLAIFVIGVIGIIVAGSLYWDRGSDTGGRFVSGWLTDRYGTDISARVDAIDDVESDLPEVREFHDRDAYLEFLDSYHREFVGSMERFSELVSRPQLRDDDWSDAVAREIATIRHLEEAARSASPPEEFQAAHEHWVNGMGEYSRAVDSAASAADNMSLSELGSAIGSLSTATQSYISMAETLDDMGALRDLETLEELRNVDLQR